MPLISKEQIVIINNTQAPLLYFSDVGLKTLCLDVKDIDTVFNGQKKYLTSPANSLLFMDGGIDLAYMKMFDGIQQSVQNKMRKSEKIPLSKLGRKYLPIGASMLYKIDNNNSLVSAPTMFFPQDVSNTNNAYNAMKAILSIVSKNVTDDNFILVVPMLCCGYGKMSYEKSAEQILMAINDQIDTENEHSDFYFQTAMEQKIIDESQPKFYSNTEFIDIDVGNIKNC